MKKLPSVKPHVLNLTHHICEHFLGESHTVKHRMGVGMIIMFIGVYVAHSHTDIMLVSIAYNIFGYTIHAIGAIPYVEWLTHYKQNLKTDEQPQSEPNDN